MGFTHGYSYLTLSGLDALVMSCLAKSNFGGNFGEIFYFIMIKSGSHLGAGVCPVSKHC
ncbi:hypothetical protein BH11BAC3_BH11BAC3_38830 [soil metagenome]